MINCIFAKRISESVTECKNSEKLHLHQAAQAYCFRCKHRVAINRFKPAIVEQQLPEAPQAKQMTLEEWLGK